MIPSADWAASNNFMWMVSVRIFKIQLSRPTARYSLAFEKSRLPCFRIALINVISQAVKTSLTSMQITQGDVIEVHGYEEPSTLPVALKGLDRRR